MQGMCRIISNFHKPPFPEKKQQQKHTKKQSFMYSNLFGHVKTIVGTLS